MRGPEDTTPSTNEREPGRRSGVLALRSLLPRDTAVHALVGQKVVIGRGDDADIRIAGEKVSRHHTELHRQGPIYALRDLGSTNGTFVDGRRVQHCAVREDMVLRCGDWLGLVEELDECERAVPFAERIPGVFGGARLANAVQSIERLAHSDLPLVLVGPTGSGKEVFARACHVKSGRQGPFHAVNCAALPLELADGELFGYRRGAFTGADRTHEGHLRAASGGTLFLDEIAELPLTIQAKLLRALERGQVLSLGETVARSFEVRILVACQQPLAELVAAGRFREDLAARLSGAEVRLPPLRERVSDIPQLFHHFMFRLSGGRPPAISTRLYEALCLHGWRGNVRELELLARRLLAEHAFEPVLRSEHLPEPLRTLRDGGSEKPGGDFGLESRREHDLRQLLGAMTATAGNISLAAELSGISRHRAYRLLKRNDSRPGDAADGAGNANGSTG